MVKFVVLMLLAACAGQAREHYATLTPEQRIVDVQTRLSELRYETGPVDGKMGPLTRRAIKEFQAANGLTPDGLISEELYTRLRSFGPRRGTGRAIAVDGRAYLDQFRGNWEGKLDCGQHYGKRQRANARVSMSLSRQDGKRLIGRVSWRGGSEYRTGNSRVYFSLAGKQHYPTTGELFAEDAINRIGRRWQTTSASVGEISAREISQDGVTSDKCVLTLSRF